MEIDMSQFADAFLDEAGENLEDLEAGLLQLENGANADMDAIFRAAHSIKGGAGTFGFNAVADFTHVVESLLEKTRDGDISVTSELTTELLKSVDVIGELLAAAREKREAKADDQDRCLQALEAYMIESGETPTVPGAGGESGLFEDSSGSSNEERLVRIDFVPMPHLTQTGNDPINIFKELKDLGDITAIPSLDDLPQLDEINPEMLYLKWELVLVTFVSDDSIYDAFLFVSDDADISIITRGAMRVDGKTYAEEKAESNVAEIATATPMDERRKGEERRKNSDRRGNQSAAPANSFIRVDISKVDNLLNLVGELVTTNAMVTQHMEGMNTDEHQQLSDAAADMARHTRNMQEAIMSIRMMPVDFVFNRFPRMVRDTATKLGKQVRLETDGAQTELDKTVIERITDPLTHLVRNSIDHGVELPEERVAAGKPAEGIVQLSAFYRGGSVVIEIRDDGRGLSREKILSKALEKGLVNREEMENMPDEMVWDFIFNSGFSTATEVTDVSGRGVGMDVVRKNIQSLGGSIAISSEAGVGSCISVSLPLTLAIVDGMATSVGNEIYLIPLLSILESLRPSESLVRKVQDGVEVIDFRGEYLPLLRISEVLSIAQDREQLPLEEGIAVVVESDAGRVALFVDDLLGERQVVIKNIEDNYRAVEGISGATILGDGRVALIVDLTGLVKMAAREGKYLKRKTHNISHTIVPDIEPSGESNNFNA